MALPAGVTFVDNGDGSANLSGTPTLSGSFPVTITANNGIGGPVTQNFTLSVHEAPAITSGASTSFLELTPGDVHGDDDGLSGANDHPRRGSAARRRHVHR